jgi:hypothetical protein
MNSPVWPDWPIHKSYHDRVWAIVQEHLAGREEFDSAALRPAAIFREQMHDPRSGAPAPSAREASGGRPVWMIKFPVPTIADADSPRVSQVFERAAELFGRAPDEGAA